MQTPASVPGTSQVMFQAQHRILRDYCCVHSLSSVLELGGSRGLRLAALEDPCQMRGAKRAAGGPKSSHRAEITPMQVTSGPEALDPPPPPAPRPVPLPTGLARASIRIVNRHLVLHGTWNLHTPLFEITSSSHHSALVPCFHMPSMHPAPPFHCLEAGL